MAHICTASLACHAEVNFILVSMDDDVTRSRSIETHRRTNRLESNMAYKVKPNWMLKVRFCLAISRC